MANAVWAANFSLPWIAEKGWCWLAVILGVFPFLGLFLISLMLWLKSGAIFQNEFIVHEKGIAVFDANGMREIPWENVSRLVGVEVRERIPILHFPANMLLPRWRSKKYELWTDSETEPLVFDRTSIRDLSSLASRLYEAAKKHGFPVCTRQEFEI